MPIVEESKRLHVTVSGRVQGVNFRLTSLHRARALRLTGWVRNLPNGVVETIAEGKVGALVAYLQFLQVGPNMAKVQSVEAKWEAPTDQFSSFEIR